MEFKLLKIVKNNNRKLTNYMPRYAEIFLFKFILELYSKGNFYYHYELLCMISFYLKFNIYKYESNSCFLSLLSF